MRVRARLADTKRPAVGAGSAAASATSVEMHVALSLYEVRVRSAFRSASTGGGAAGTPFVRTRLLERMPGLACAGCNAPVRMGNGPSPPPLPPSFLASCFIGTMGRYCVLEVAGLSSKLQSRSP